MNHEPRYIHEWGNYLSPAQDNQGNIVEHKKLTLEEAQLYATMSCADYTRQMLAHVEDIDRRVTRLEIFLSSLFPTYNNEVRKQLVEAGVVS